MYSQNKEEKYILEYFKGKTGCVLDIGANDGKTFSNSLALIELGWAADLVEPSPKAFDKLKTLHHANKNVFLWNCAVSTVRGVVPFYESGYLINKNDVSLVSSIKKEELARWKKVNFKTIEVEAITIIDLESCTELSSWDFITIDAEGYDYEILTQLNLSSTYMVCVEHNGIETEKYINYCEAFGMRLIYKSGENILMAK